MLGGNEQMIVEIQCGSHGHRLRSIMEALTYHYVLRVLTPFFAPEALKRIGKLYAIEEEARAMEPASRALHRRQNSVPILAGMHDWLIHLRISTADGSGLARAIDYSD